MDECRCLCCDRTLDRECVDNPLVLSAVYGGLIFRSLGNYGSKVFDPIACERGGELLQITICDTCVVEKVHGSRVVLIRDMGMDRPAQAELFDPDKE